MHQSAPVAYEIPTANVLPVHRISLFVPPNPKSNISIENDDNTLVREGSSLSNQVLRNCCVLRRRSIYAKNILYATFEMAEMWITMRFTDSGSGSSQDQTRHVVHITRYTLTNSWAHNSWWVDDGNWEGGGDSVRTVFSSSQQSRNELFCEVPVVRAFDLRKCAHRF